MQYNVLVNHDAENDLLQHFITHNELLDGVDMEFGKNFDRGSNANLFSLIKTMRTEGKDIDIVSITQEIIKKHGFNNMWRFGGPESINRATHILNVSNYSTSYGIVSELGRRRRLIEIYKNAAQELADISNDDMETVSKYMDKITSTATEAKDGDTIKFGDEMQEVFNEICSGHKADGTLTYFTDVDKNLYGLQKGQLIILAARPAMGKTSFAMNVAEHICGEANGNVLIFSLEMSRKELVKRMWGGRVGIPYAHMRGGTLTDEEKIMLIKSDYMYNFDLGIEDDGYITLDKMKLKAKRWKEKHNGNIDLIIIDYLQLLNVPGFKPDNTVGRVSHATRELKLLARELECPIMVLSQLNRSVEQRADKRPMLADLRDSGSIEQDADVVLFLYRDAYYAEQAGREEYDPWAELHIAKNRAGKTTIVRLGWNGERTRFLNLDFSQVLGKEASNGTAREARDVFSK